LEDPLNERLAESEAKLRESRALVKTLSTGIEHYQAALEDALSRYREQRAWRLMIAVRKAYDLWTRRGWKGKLRAVPMLLSAPFQKSGAFEDQEIRLPSIRSYVPDAGGCPEETESHPFTPLQRKYDVVILPIVDFDYRFQRPQQIAAQFAKNGHRVFWISPARFVPTNNSDPYFLHPLRDNLWEVHLRARLPNIYLGELQPEERLAAEESLRRLYTDLAISENLILAQLPFWRGLALSLRQEHGAVLAYDCMDEWDSFENMGEFNRAEERALVQECDLLLVTAERLRQKFITSGASPVLIRNAVDYDFFAGAASQSRLASIPKPIVGYFGAIADWIDLDLIYQVARQRPRYSFVLIGQVFGRDVKALQSLPNVHLLGNQPYESIPSYLREFDACTIPFLLNGVTAATDPVKLYEYLSLGKPVVATDMAEIRAYRDLIYIAKTVEEFAKCLDRCLAESGDDRRNRRIAFAKENTWMSRVAAIDSTAAAKFPRVSIVIVTHNSARYIEPCVNSILRHASYPNYELIVVDNASTDGTADLLKRHTPQIHCEFLEKNRGYAAGNNIGAKLAKGKYLVLLNADTLVTPGWLGRLIWHLEHDFSIGLLCAVTNFAGNEAKIPIEYSDETSMEGFAALLATWKRHLSTELSMAPLFCGVMRRDLYFELQGLDEGYGIGMFEDDDLSASVRARGLRVVAAEDCFVHHFGQGSFSKLAPQEYTELFETNRKRFEQKWGIHWTPHRLRPQVIPPDQDVRFQPESFCASPPREEA